MKKQLILLSFAACSVAFASENSGNMRQTIVAKAAESARLAAEIAAVANNVAQEVTQEQPAAPAITQEATKNLLPRMWDVTTTFVSSQAKNASEYAQPKLDAIKDRITGLEVGNKFTQVKEFAQKQYESAINSTIVKKASEYAKSVVALAKENPKIATAIAIATGTTITTLIVKKYLEYREEKKEWEARQAAIRSVINNNLE